VLDLTFFNKLLARRRAIMMTMAAAFGLLVLATGSAQSFDRFMRQLRDGVRSQAASGEIHIVEIDARSLQAIEKWPWPRSKHAAAIDRLVEAGARTIAFDVDFSGLSEPAEDAELARALKRAGGSVILPTFRQQAGSGSSNHIDATPAKPFIDNAFLGAVTVVPDSDGYVRHMPLGVETKQVPRPSIASMLAESTATIGEFFEIDFSIEPSTIPRHSFIDLIEGRVPATALNGKRVLIGATAIEMGDRYVVPRYGVISGVVVQALAAETLMKGKVPQQLGPLPPLALALLLVLACVRGGSRRWRAILFGLGTLMIVLLPVVSEQLAATSLHIGPAVAALVVAAVVAGATILGERFRTRAMIDGTTGLPNMTALEEAFRSSGGATVLVARIDRFSAVAAGLGADAAARLVSRVADRIGMAHDKRIVYRTDEASLAWIEPAGEESMLEDRLEAIAAVMRSPVDCGQLVDVTLHIGMASDNQAEVKQLVANASLATIHAARKGIRWEHFSAADSDEANWHLTLLTELEGAMMSGQVWNAYQPKLDLKTGRIIGAEALVRWLHPQRGPIAPDNFIPLIEQHGRAGDITFHVLARALEDVAQWDEAGLPIGVAVNVSASLLSDGEFIDQIRKTLEATNTPTDRITIEVTESATMKDPEQAIRALRSWRALGLNISIDDYGTGQSSLGYLQKLPATELKIDKSFVQTINDDARNAIMVRSTIALAHELGMKVVAEGIEDEACLQTLTEFGCDTGQGYHIGRPMSAANLRVFLQGERRQAA
jgi:EAL domain-containing protein (putative c-di-GMP-specific phosphodiesterase class I)/CHASE2 domain-containing sensor protein